MRRALLGALCAMVVLPPVLVSCAARPSRKDALAAPIGEPPDYEEATRSAELLIRLLLRNPDSAVIRFDREIERGWYEGPWWSVNYAWLLTAEVDSANVFGARTGFRPWLFFWRDGKLVAHSQPVGDAWGSTTIITTD